MFVSTMQHCMHLCIYMSMCKVLIKNIFGHGIELLAILLYGDSIFTIQDFAFSKND